MELRDKQRAVIEALEDVKGHDIVVYDTARLPTMFERVVIASGDSNRHVRALASHVKEKIREAGSRVYGVEGESSGEWVLVDLGEIVVHIMHPTVRGFYNLEEVWSGKKVRLAAKKKAPAPKKAPSPPRKKARAAPPRPRRRR